MTLLPLDLVLESANHGPWFKFALFLYTPHYKKGLFQKIQRKSKGHDRLHMAHKAYYYMAC